MRYNESNMIDRPIPRRARTRRRFRLKWPLRIFGAVILVCFVANGAMIAIYHNKALPRAHIGRLAAGGLSYTALARVSPDTILPPMFTLQKGTTTVSMAPSALGLSIDVPASVQSIPAWQRWLPLLSVVMHEDIPLHTHINTAIYQQASASLGTRFSLAAQPQHIVFTGSNFAVAEPSQGYVLDAAALPTALVRAANEGNAAVSVPTTPIAAPAASGSLAATVQELQKQLAVKLSFVYKSQHIDPTVHDIGNWYVSDGQTMKLSPDRIASYIKTTTRKQAGITVANPDDLATAASYALEKNLPVNLNLVPQTSNTVVRTYCTAVRGVSTSVLDDLIGKLAATYNDTRGWNNSGQIAFEHVDNGCQYTVWMSAAGQMTSFGAICDDYYNCQVGGNVVLNYDRWTSATDPWNATHGSIEDYHVLMIDHETGHRLGFLDNPTCPAAGQPAPVMMQQSIDLKGCTFNIWPLAMEFAQLDTSLGLPAPSAVSE